MYSLCFKMAEERAEAPYNQASIVPEEADWASLIYAQGVKANVLFFDKKEASETPWTKTLWIYDLRTNKHFTLKTDPLKREDLDEFVKCYNPENRYQREPTWSESNPTGRWRAYNYEELINRDKANLDIFWLRDESLEDSDNLPDPDVLAQEIVALRLAKPRSGLIGVNTSKPLSNNSAKSRMTSGQSKQK